MKLIATYILLFCYSAAMFKPMMPSIVDFIAHSFINEYHISTVHHSHGEDHVHKEVQKVATEENKTENAPKQKNAEPVSVHVISVNNFTACTEYLPEEYKIPYSLNINQPMHRVNIPPPKTFMSFL